MIKLLSGQCPENVLTEIDIDKELDIEIDEDIESDGLNIRYIKEKTGYSLTKSTLPTETKFNIFILPLDKKEHLNYE